MEQWCFMWNFFLIKKNSQRVNSQFSHWKPQQEEQGLCDKDSSLDYNILIPRIRLQLVQRQAEKNQERVPETSFDFSTGFPSPPRFLHTYLPGSLASVIWASNPYWDSHAPLSLVPSSTIMQVYCWQIQKKWSSVLEEPQLGTWRSTPYQHPTHGSTSCHYLVCF